MLRRHGVAETALQRRKKMRGGDDLPAYLSLSTGDSIENRQEDNSANISGFSDTLGWHSENHS